MKIMRPDLCYQCNIIARGTTDVWTISIYIYIIKRYFHYECGNLNGNFIRLENKTIMGSCTDYVLLP
jgi:hypothetical protein